MPKTGTGLQTIFCQRCGKEMQVWLSHAKRKFCSVKCRITPVKERFWSKVDKSGPCWIWKACLNQDGYGHFPWSGEVRAHRIAWILTNGPIPKGSCVLHDPVLCNNRACVNPGHLRLGKQLDNVRDMIKIGTKWHAAGESHPNSLMDRDVVIEIRKTYNTVSVESIAAKFKVTVAAVRDVAKGRSWQSVEPKNYWDAQGVKRKTRQDNISNIH